MDAAAVGVTLRLAAWTTLGVTLIGVPIAYWLATTRRRAKVFVEAVVSLPLVLPPTVVGFYLLVATGSRGWLGRNYEAVTGRPLAFSFAGILLGSILLNLPFAVRPFAAAFTGVPRELVEASWCLGVGRARTFVRVVIPLAWPGLLGGMILTFAHTVGEFGVVLMTGGNIPGETRTLSVAVYDDVQALDYAAAGRTAAALVACGFVAVAAAGLLARRGPRP